MAIVEDMANIASFANLMNNQDVLTKVLNHFTKKGMDLGDKTTSIPLVDILATPKEYIFYVDVPGLSKSDIQLKLERGLPQKMMRKFRLPQDADVSTISAKCENGVLTVTIQKIPPVKRRFRKQLHILYSRHSS